VVESYICNANLPFREAAHPPSSAFAAGSGGLATGIESAVSPHGSEWTVAKEKRHKVTLTSRNVASSLDAILEESRSLRRQMADDLSNEARKLRQMSRHVSRARRAATHLDEQPA
jgi:hypothetical protein